MAEVQMISPPVHVYAKEGRKSRHAVYGWYVIDSVNIMPIVANPDGPGIGPWRLYYGEDPWSIV